MEAEDYSKVFEFGVSWSETYQASRVIEKTDYIMHDALEKFGNRFSANIVVGNEAYGFKPKYASLQNMARSLSGGRLAKHSSRIKLGAEGLRNGTRAIELASDIEASAYILHTPHTQKLLDHARSKKVQSLVYTLCRLSDSKERAARDLLAIKGSGYFERRRVPKEEIPKRLGDFSVYGTAEDVAREVSEFISMGASKVVVYPVFSGTKDLIEQMNILSDKIFEA